MGLYIIVTAFKLERMGDTRRTFRNLLFLPRGINTTITRSPKLLDVLETQLSQLFANVILSFINFTWKLVKY